MTSKKAVQNIAPNHLIIFSSTKADGEKLLKKVDGRAFRSISVATVSTLDGLLRQVTEERAVLLVDRSLSDTKTRKMLKEIRKDTLPSHLAILGLPKKQDLDQIKKLSDFGISDFQTSPVSEEVLNARLAICLGTLEREKAIYDATVRDSLTGLPNRQYFLEQCQSLYASAKREQISLTLSILAPDHLDEINRQYGQAVGDGILRGLAEILSRRKRDTDLMCRFEGNRFCIMNVNMRETHLITYLDDLLASCQAQPFDGGSQKLWMTASIGATTYLGRDIHDMILQAEEALFQSRENGHNRFTIQNEMTSQPIPVRSFN